jgi:tetratricopeptide (TPR) repeat protein
MKTSTKKPHSKKFKKTIEKKSPVQKSPSISRSITEKHPKSAHEKQSWQAPDLRYLKSLILNKYFLVSFLTTFLGVAITLQGISVQKSLHQLTEINAERQKIEGEVAYWQRIVTERPNYRDAYFKLALLEYQLGNKTKTKEYIEKTLELDPNYTPALDFRKELGVPYSL